MNEKQKNKRIAELLRILHTHDSHLRYRGDWVCVEHNAMGSYDTNRFCCEREYYELTKKESWIVRILNKIKKVFHRITCAIYNGLLKYIYGKKKN